MSKPDFDGTYWPIVETLAKHGIALHKAGQLKMRPTIEARREEHLKLKGEGKTVREIAKITGTPRSTVGDDLSENRSKAARKPRKHKTEESENRTVGSDQPAQKDAPTAGCPDCDKPIDFWRRSLENHAAAAGTLRSFWDSKFGKEWRQFEVTRNMVDFAKQAAPEWTELAAELTARSGE